MDLTGSRRAERRLVATPTLSVVTADPRLGPYAVLVAVGVVLAVVTGSAPLLAVAIPPAFLLARGVRSGRPPAVRVEVVEPPVRVAEGDRWTLDVALTWNGTAEIDVIHGGVDGHRLVGSAGLAVTATGGCRWEVTVDAVRWGRHPLGRIEVRSRRPGGLAVLDAHVDLPGTVRVLPGASRLDALLRPARPRVASGAHVASTRGPGTDFADLRPYTPGDRLRDLSWSASARSDVPWVVVHHPERTGTVVLVLDGFADAGLPGGALDRTARVVWSLARHHLEQGDRVGLLAAGPAPRWLPPLAGRRCRWIILDGLLDAAPRARPPTGGSGPGHVSGSPSTSPSASMARGPFARRAHDGHVPADAVIVGVGALQSDAFVADMVHHRRQGRPTVVIGVEVEDLLARPNDEVERAARRLWRLESEVRRTDLARAGVVSVLVADDVGGAVRALARMRRRDVVASR